MKGQGMGGECDLQRLLKEMRPMLDPEVYVFATLPSAVADSQGAGALMRFSEAEGETVIIAEKLAETRGLSASFPCRRITLRIHSALEAVGFLAKVASTLAMARIPSNAVSAYYHDHLFVPVERANDAMRVLTRLAKRPEH